MFKDEDICALLGTQEKIFEIMKTYSKDSEEFKKLERFLKITLYIQVV
jgi:hypothetical protein